MKIVDQLSRYIEIALGKEIYTQKEHGGGSGGRMSCSDWAIRGVAPRDQQLSPVAETEEDENGGYVLIKEFALTDPRNGGVLGYGAGLTIDDFNPQISVYELFPTGDEYINRDQKQLALILQGKKNALAMNNQWLQNNRSLLSFYDIGRLLCHMDCELCRDDLSDSQITTIVLLMLTMFYGLDVFDSLTMFVVNNHVKKLETDTKLAYIKSERRIMVKVASMTSGNQLSEKAKEQAISVGKYLVLGVPEALASAIERLDKNRLSEQRSGYLLFVRDKGRCVDEVNRYIREAMLTNASYISLRKTSFARIVSAAGDIADAIMITGHANGMAKTRLHYTTRSCRSLYTIHKKATNSLVDEVAYEFEWDEEKKKSWLIADNEYIQTGYVGSRLTPKPQAIKELVGNLVDKLNRLKTEFDWYKFHNAYTAYTLLMLDYSTGSRSVNRKYALKSSINVEKGVVILSDKEADDFYNTRVAPLTSLCSAQWGEYLNHRDLVLARLLQRHEQVTDNLLAADFNMPRSWRANAINEYVDSNIGPIFFIDEVGNPTAKLPKHTKLVLQDIWHLALNVNRHYLRFQLREHDVGGEYIDALLGHWQTGEEPYGRYSTLSVEEVFLQVTPVITKVMHEDGWKVIKGLSSGY